MPDFTSPITDAHLFLKRVYRIAMRTRTLAAMLSGSGASCYEAASYEPAL